MSLKVYVGKTYWHMKTQVITVDTEHLRYILINLCFVGYRNGMMQILNQLCETLLVFLNYRVFIWHPISSFHLMAHPLDLGICLPQHCQTLYMTRTSCLSDVMLAKQIFWGQGGINLFAQRRKTAKAYSLYMACMFVQRNWQIIGVLHYANYLLRTNCIQSAESNSGSSNKIFTKQILSLWTSQLQQTTEFTVYKIVGQIICSKDICNIFKVKGNWFLHLIFWYF